MKTKRRLLSLLMAGAVLFSTMPVNALAVGNPDPGGPCEHHREHTAECGYTEGEEGSPCTHEHTEDCYILTTKCVHEHDEGCYPEDSVSDSNATPSNAEEREPENCPHVCSEESGCITKELDCQHEHDGDCGYIPASEGTPCTFVCGICNPADSGKEESGKTEDTELEDTIPENTETEVTEPEEAETEDTNLCAHHKEHTEDCGFVPATEDSEGSPCTYECRICPIEDLIAALPDEVTADNAEDVRAQLDGILALYGELDEEEQEQIDLSRCMELQEALDAANAPVPAAGEVSADYQEASWSNGAVTYTDKTTDSCTLLTGNTVAWGTDSQETWYVAEGDVTISEPITVSGDVHLILADDCTLTADKGIVVTADNSLTIYAQAGGTGTLNATGVFENNAASAGIGGSAVSPDSGAVTIHGGRIHATGGGKSRFYGAAGIGGGVPVFDNGQNGGDSGAVTIFGGTVTADSGVGGVTGAGIGGGAGIVATGQCEGGDGNNITIYGGTVTATSHGGGGGAGIGGGGNGGDAKGGDGSHITICGGTVTATGSTKGAGIGGGAGSGVNKASGSGSNITISGGVVTAVGGQYAAGIGGGGGFSDQPGGAGTYIEITGGIVDAYSPPEVHWVGCEGDPIGNGGNAGEAVPFTKDDCIIFENGVGLVYGDVILTETYDVPANYNLTIPSGATLEGTGTLTGGGEFWIEDITEDMLSVPTGWHYTSDNMAAEIEAAVRLNGNVEICGKTFQARTEGWELSVAKVTDLEYTVTYAHDGKTPVTKTVTLAPATTTLSGVASYKADGTTPATTFGVNETIIVKAKPEIGSNAAVTAANLAGPTAKQMALYVNNTQVSAPAVVGPDGSYTMTVSAADVLAAAQAEPNGGAISLTAKFVGNDSQSGAEETVEITITAVAQVEMLDGTTTYFTDLAEAFAKARAGMIVTLLDDVELTEAVDITVTGCTLDLNGHTILNQQGACISTYGGRDLTIQDSGTGGTIKSATSNAFVSEGVTTLKGGRFLTGAPDQYSGVKLGSSSSGLTVTGESVYIDILNISVNALQNTSLSAGTYGQIMIYGMINETFADLLATDKHYAYYDANGTPLRLDGLGTVEGQVLSLTGPVTVKACGHEASVRTYVHVPDTATHSMTCLACGKTEAAEDCDFGDWTPVDETNHQRTCKLCGYVETEAHTLALSARSEGFTIIVTAKCSACGYGKEYSREILEYMGNLVYGQGMAGISLRNQSGESARYAIYRLDDGAEEITGLPAELPAGNHTLHVVLVFGEPDSPIETNSIDIPFTVKKKPLAVTHTAAAGRAYNGTNTVTITGVTLSGKVKDTDDVSVDTSSLTGTINGTDAGDYTSVTLPAMTLTGVAAGNYTLTHPTGAVSTSVEITKATAPAAQNGKMLVSIDLKHTYSYTLDQLLPVLTGGQTFGTVAYTLGTVSLGDYYTDGAAITGNKLSLPVNAVQSDKEEVVGTIPITISSKNFQDITAEITVSSVKQIVPEGTPTASPSTITYGQPISSITISGQMHGGADPVEGKFEWDSPNVIPDAGEYQAPWTFKPNNSGLYTEVTGYITITVQKATPSLTLTPSSATMPDGGTVTLTLSGLPAGGSATVTCSNDTISVTKGNGDTWTADLPAGGGSYTFTASYAGDGNHTGATANCTVSVEKIKPTLVLSASPKSLNGGGEVMLTLTGLPDKGEATVSCSDSSITVTRSGENWKASLPNKTAEYTFTANYSGDAQHTSAEAACTVSVTQHTSGDNGGSSGGNTGGNSGSNSGGGNSGSGSGGSTIINRPDEKHPDIPTTSETKPVKPDKDGNVSIGGDPIQDAINKATIDANKNGNKENGIAVTVPVDHAADAESLAVTIPAGTLDQLIAAKVRRFDITTNGLPCFSFTLDTLKMFDGLPNGGSIILRLSKTTALSKQAKEAVGTRPVYDFSFVFVKDGKETPITDWKGQTVSVRMPYTPAKDEQAGNLYAVYVDAKGKVEWLTKSSYDADQKALIFEASHFSIYGVGYKNPAPVFTDITGHWATDNIIFVASRGLLAGTGNNKFSPNTGMTRGMFVTALGRLAGIDPESYKTGKFTDVKADAYYAPYVNWAAEKGIVSGTSATTFSPDTNITREQMAVIMANYAKKMGYDLPVAHEAVTFADNAQISSWAAKEVKAMQQAGIMAGKGGNRFDPKGTATRAEVATVLRRFVEIVIDPQAAQGWMQDHSGFWQYMKDGKAVTGWLYDDKKWYWLDKDGRMFAGGFKMIDGKWYYFHTDGTMAANTTIDGYTIGPDGARK